MRHAQTVRTLGTARAVSPAQPDDARADRPGARLRGLQCLPLVDQPRAARTRSLFGLWNGMLAFYLGFAFLQAWIRSIAPMVRHGRRGSPTGAIRRRWTALGVAEATVIGGTMFCCSAIVAGWSTIGLDGLTGPSLTTICCVSGASDSRSRAGIGGAIVTVDAAAGRPDAARSCCSDRRCSTAGDRWIMELSLDRSEPDRSP